MVLRSRRFWVEWSRNFDFRPRNPSIQKNQALLLQRRNRPIVHRHLRRYQVSLREVNRPIQRQQIQVKLLPLSTKSRRETIPRFRLQGRVMDLRVHRQASKQPLHDCLVQSPPRSRMGLQNLRFERKRKGITSWIQDLQNQARDR